MKLPLPTDRVLQTKLTVRCVVLESMPPENGLDKVWNACEKFYNTPIKIPCAACGDLYDYFIGNYSPAYCWNCLETKSLDQLGKESIERREIAERRVDPA